MHVQITRRLVHSIRQRDPAEVYEWALVKNDGTAICRSPVDGFPTEKECRSHIAEAKKSMKAASRCKVVSP